MASAYSTPNTYEPYVQQLPMDAIAAGLQYKQSKYDANREKLQNYLNLFSDLDLIKPEDQEHFYNNLQHLKANIDKMGMGDLSLNGVTEQIAQYIGHAADDKVLNGVAGTKVYRNIMETADWYQKNDKEGYNDRNLAFSLRGIKDWASDGIAGSSYKDYDNVSTDYIPYTDVFARASEVLDKIEPNVTMIPNMDEGGFYFLDEEHRIISDHRIVSALESAVFSDSAIAQQMQINSWATTEQLDDVELSERGKKYYQERTTQNNKYIAELKDEKATNPENAELIQEMIDARNRDNSTIFDKLDNWDDNFESDRESIALRLYQKDFTDGMIDIYATKEVTWNRTVNDFALAQYKNQLKAQSDSKGHMMDLIETYHDNPSLAMRQASFLGLGGALAQIVQMTDAGSNQMVDVEDTWSWLRDQSYQVRDNATFEMNGLSSSIKHEYEIDLNLPRYSTDESILKLIEDAEGNAAKQKMLRDYLDSRQTFTEFSNGISKAEEEFYDEWVESLAEPGDTRSLGEGAKVKRTKSGKLVYSDKYKWHEKVRDIWHQNAAFARNYGQTAALLADDIFPFVLSPTHRESLLHERNARTKRMIKRGKKLFGSTLPFNAPGMGVTKKAGKTFPIFRSYEMHQTVDNLDQAFEIYKHSYSNMYNIQLGEKLAGVFGGDIPALKTYNLSHESNIGYVDDVLSHVARFDEDFLKLPKELNNYAAFIGAVKAGQTASGVPVEAHLVDVGGPNPRLMVMVNGKAEKPIALDMTVRTDSALSELQERQEQAIYDQLKTRRSDNLTFNDVEEELNDVRAEYQNRINEGKANPDQMPNVWEKAKILPTTESIELEDGSSIAFTPILNYRVSKVKTVAGGFETVNTIIPQVTISQTLSNGEINPPVTITPPSQRAIKSRGEAMAFLQQVLQTYTLEAGVTSIKSLEGLTF